MNIYSKNILSGGAGSGVSILSNDLNNVEVRFHIKTDNTSCIAIAKNKKAVKKIEKWHKQFFDEEKKETTIPELEKMIANSSDFDLITDEKEVYREYLKLCNNPRPNKNFEFLQKWYFDNLEIEKKNKLEKVIDTEPEILKSIEKEIEIKFTEKKIAETKQKYFPEPNPNARYVHPAAIVTPNEIETMVNKIFLEWLEQRKKDLVQPTNSNEEIEIVPDEIQQCVVWLYAIGVIDFIKEKHKIHSPTTIGKILSKGMTKPAEMRGELWDAIKKAIERIEKENLLSKYNDYINKTCRHYKIVRIK